MNKINLPQAAKLTSPNPVPVVCTQKPVFCCLLSAHVCRLHLWEFDDKYGRIR